MMRTKQAAPGRGAFHRSPARDTAALCLALALAVPATAARAQLAYEHTTFVHGTASSGEIWTKSYPALGSRTPLAYLGGTVNLRDALAPSLDARQGYLVQRNQLVAFLQGAPGQHVLVGHSLGGIEARGAYLYTSARPQISGIITVAATHRGTYLADNREEVKRFFLDVQRRVDQATFSCKSLLVLIADVFTPLGATVMHLGPKVLAPVFTGLGVMSFIPIDTDLELAKLYQLVDLPAVADQATTSPVIRDLQSSLSDAAVPRANIYGQIPFRNAAIRVKASMSGDEASYGKTVHKRNLAMTAFKACKVVGYSIIIGSRSARRCAFGAKVLGRVDDRWLGYVNGRDAQGRARAIPFDGVVSNENSQYPTTNALRLDRAVSGVNHQNIYGTRPGLDAVADAMIAVGMERAAASSLAALPIGAWGANTPPRIEVRRAPPRGRTPAPESPHTVPRASSAR